MKKETVLKILEDLAISLIIINGIFLLIFPGIAIFFEELYLDFELPFITNLLLTPAYPITAGITVLMTLFLLKHRWVKKSLKKRWSILIIGFIYSLALVVIVIMGIYLPLFRM